jgi:SulP family sulfate permease
VAVVSLMTAAAVGVSRKQGTPDTSRRAHAGLPVRRVPPDGVLRLGFLANFLSHPVIAGFITASGLIIAASQLKHILGIRRPATTCLNWSVAGGAHGQHQPDHAGHRRIAAAFLFWVRKGLKPLLDLAGMKPKAGRHHAKAGPVAAVAVTTSLAWGLGPRFQGVASWAMCRKACRRSPCHRFPRPVGQPDRVPRC